ncbi:hypothetical protein BGZ73_006825 [Actinomortierella ambigua]|nr:hypothetical protein BGZ73_006825 [Actinomortierella ambigua]
MAEPQSIADYPLDPRRVWKLFWIAVSSVWGDLQLLPVGISLVRYRYRNTTRSGHHGSLLVDIQYNPLRPENKLDVHIPIEKFEANANSIRIGGRSMENHEARIKGGNTHSSHLRPVVVFVYGGAWSSGSKWMYTLIGARLSQMGYVAVIPDYSLYPKGKIKEMEGDVKLAIQWAYRNCREFGGDPNRLYAMGHSAGGQLVALAVIKDALQRLPSSLIDEAMAQSSMLQRILQENNWARRRHGAQATDSDPSMDILPRLRGVILCSSPFDIGEHYRHEAMRGVEQVSAMGRVMGMDERDAFPRHSPTRILAELMRASTHGIRHRETMMDQQTRHQHMLRQLRNLMPIETLLIHGDDDKTVPMRSTREFFKQLKAIQLGPSVRFKVMEGMGHIEPVLALMPSFAVNDPFTDPLMDEIACFIEGGHQA